MYTMLTCLWLYSKASPPVMLAPTPYLDVAECSASVKAAGIGEEGVEMKSWCEVVKEGRPVSSCNDPTVPNGGFVPPLPKGEPKP